MVIDEASVESLCVALLFDWKRMGLSTLWPPKDL